MYSNSFRSISSIYNAIITDLRYVGYSNGKKYLKNILVSKYFSRFGKIINVRGDNGRVLEWIKRYDTNYDKRERINDTNILEDDALFTFVIDENTVVIVINDSFRRPAANGCGNFKIIIFGKHHKKYYKELKDIVKNNSHNNLYQYNVSGKPYNNSYYGTAPNNDNTQKGQQTFFTSTCKDLPMRNIDTLFFNDGVKEKVLNHIEGFFDNESIYTDRNLLYKTGILLYGEPGTGKTSLVTALANYYNMSLIVLDMNTFETLDTDLLSTYLSNDNYKYIILLEDIDCIFDKLDRSSGTDKDERKIINKMLQFLDSNNSPTNVIFIATTNYVTKLDDAITRKGRFDKSIHIGAITYDVAVEMCRSFDVPEEDISDINTPVANAKGLYNQSYLQDSILEYFKTKNRKTSNVIEEEE